MGDIEDICQYYIGLGFGGFRCDVAAQIPAFFIRKLIGLVRLEHGKYCIFSRNTLDDQF